MSNSVKKEKKQLVIDIAIVLTIAIIIVAVIILLSSGKETIVTSEHELDARNTVVCSNSTGAGSFFDSDDDRPTTQEIKVVLTNNKASTFFYYYKQVFSSESEAEYDLAIKNANFNKYYSNYNINTDDFSPRFETDGKTIAISFYADSSHINSYTSKLFVIDSGEFDRVKSLSQKALKAFYENKGFSCNIVE